MNLAPNRSATAAAGQSRSLWQRAIKPTFQPLLALAVGLSLPPESRAQTTQAPRDQRGAVVRQISSPVSGEYIRNAEIRVEGSNIMVNSTDDGSYRIYNLPAGEYVIRAAYTGYETSVATVTVSPGGTTVRNFALSSPSVAGDAGNLIRMEAMTVSTGREGQAKGK